MMKKHCLLSMMIMALLCIEGCSLYTNNPPVSNEPEPAPHNGVFVSEDNDTLFFNGDGHTIRWSFVEGVPNIGTTGSGSYLFKFNHGQCRYDLAEYFFIYTPDNHFEQFHLCAERASETAIPMMRYDLSDDKQQVFRKINQ